MSFELKALKDICTIQIGKTPSRHENDYWRDGTHAWLSIADMNQGRYLNNTKECITDLGVKASNIKLIPKNTLVLSYKLSIGKVGITQKPMYTNEAIASLTELDSQVDINYLYWALQHIDLLENADRAAMGKTLNKAKLSEVKIPLPPLAEQRRIASILDQADDLRQKRQQAIEKLDQLLQATFIDMFGDPVSNPKGWEKKKIKQVLTKLTDGTHHSPPAMDEGIPYITAKHIKEGFIDFYSKPTFVSIEDHKAIYSRCDPKQGDVLYIKDGATTGIASINYFNFEFSLLSSVALLRPDSNLITNDYLESWLNHKTVKQNILQNMGGAAIKRLTLAKIKDLDILVPNLENQNIFSKVKRKIYNQRQILERSLSIHDDLFQSLQNQAFSGTL